MLSYTHVQNMWPLPQTHTPVQARAHTRMHTYGNGGWGRQREGRRVIGGRFHACPENRHYNVLALATIGEANCLKEISPSIKVKVFLRKAGLTPINSMKDFFANADSWKNGCNSKDSPLQNGNDEGEQEGLRHECVPVSAICVARRRLARQCF